MKRIEPFDSKIEGKGIRAIRKLKKREFVGFIKGPIKHKINKNSNDTFGNPDWVGFKKNFWIDPLPPFKYLNHSCEPSCGIKGTKSVYALRNINKGEEITVDYATTEIDEDWFLDKCNCGTKTCRGRIHSIQSLSRKKLSQYLPYVPTYFKEYIIKS